MARIVDYQIVQQRMGERGFVSLYHNSGAFGFADGAQVQTVGWIEVEDSSIREGARLLVRRVPSIAELVPKTLAQAAGDVWLMPKSHWHYELHFGNRELLEGLLPTMPIDPDALRDRNDGSAISFTPTERDLLNTTVTRMLAGLSGSDFLLAFAQNTLCTIHHHKQLWWQTSDPIVATALQQVGEA